MKKYFSSFIFICAITVACNNAGKEKTPEPGARKETPKNQADSLMADVMDGHDIGMAKMGKLSLMQRKVQVVLDSIAALPAKTRSAMVPYKEKMEAALKQLKIAKNGMEKWMDEFNMDSAVNNAEQRIKYLSEEKLKVSKVKKDILASLEKADSLIKAKIQ